MNHFKQIFLSAVSNISYQNNKNLFFKQQHSMLSASSSGARTPLSPLTQSTLEKHLPRLTPKRFLQQNKPLTAEVGCITGEATVEDN